MRHPHQSPLKNRPAVAMIVAILALVIAVLSGTGPQGLSAAPAQDPPSDPMQSLASCIAGKRELLVVLLVDESGSLRETDPNHERLDAARIASNGLSQLVDRSGNTLKAEIQVARFGTDYFGVSDWTALGADTVQSVNQAIESLRERNSALDTDYVNALTGAQSKLVERAAAWQKADAKSDPCTAILWFTDGKFDIEDRTNARRQAIGADSRGNAQYKAYAPGVDLFRPGGGKQAQSVGLNELCRSGGIADQLRTSETTLVAVALTTDLGQDDLNELQTIVAGAPGECGSLDGRTTGILFPANDLSDLTAFFDAAVQQLSNPAATDQLTTGVCPQERSGCPEGTKVFEVDAALRRFHLLAQFDSPGIAVRVTAPGAQPVDVPMTGAGKINAGATHLHYAVLSQGAITLDAESSDSGENWAGTWSVTFIDTTGQNPGAVSRAFIYLFGDVLPKLVSAEFRAGTEGTFTVELAREEGTPIPPEGFTGEVKVLASVTNPTTGETQELEPAVRQPNGTWTGTYRVPVDLTVSTVNLNLRSDVTTASGISLPPTVATVAVEILPPAGFPVIQTNRLTLGPIVGLEPQDSAQRTIEILGSETSDTCVWIGGFEPRQLPDESLRFEVMALGSGGSEGDCLEIPQGESASLDIQFLPLVESRGTASGELELISRSINSNEVRATNIDVRLDLAKPVNQSLALSLFVGLVVVGMLIPILGLYFANWWVAKFAPRSLMESCKVRVSVNEQTVTRIQSNSESSYELLNGDDFEPVGSGSTPSREFTAGGVRFKSRVSMNPLRPPTGIAVTDTASYGSGFQRILGGHAEIPLPLAGQWIFVPDVEATMAERKNVDSFESEDEGRTVIGDLIGFIPAMIRLPAIEQLADSVLNTLPHLVGQIDAEVQREASLRPQQHDDDPAMALTSSIWSSEPTVERDPWRQANSNQASADNPTHGAHPWEAPTHRSDDNLWDD